MTLPPQVRERQTVFRGKKFSVERATLTYQSGHTTTAEVVRHPGAVVIVPCLPSGELGVIRQYRHALGMSILEFPAGTLEPGEAPAACAARELVEEIGFRAATLVDLGILYPAPGFCDEKQFLFFAVGLVPASAPGDDDEIIECVPLSVGAVREAVASGEFVDAKSIAAFYRALARGLLDATAGDLRG